MVLAEPTSTGQTLLSQCLIEDTEGCKRNGGLSKNKPPSSLPKNLTENDNSKNLRDAPSPSLWFKDIYAYEL